VDVDYFNRERLEPARTAFARWVRGIRGFSTRAEARKVQAPTLVIWGAKTGHRPPADATLLAETLPNGRKVILENADLLFPLEAPDRVTAAIVDFLLQPDAAVAVPAAS
jgi:pimeloyl-ACP methyl ester carboxylesterase